MIGNDPMHRSRERQERPDHPHEVLVAHGPEDEVQGPGHKRPNGLGEADRAVGVVGAVEDEPVSEPLESPRPPHPIEANLADPGLEDPRQLQGDGGVVALVRTGERQLAPDVWNDREEVLAQGAHARGPWHVGALEERPQRVPSRPTSADDQRSVRATDAGLLTGDRLDRLAEHFRMVEADGGDIRPIEIRLFAAIAACKIMQSPPSGLAGLGVISSHDPNVRVRTLAAKLLGVVGGADTESVLSRLLRDREPEVQVAAAGSILRRQMTLSNQATSIESQLPQSTVEPTNRAKNDIPH